MTPLDGLREADFQREVLALARRHGWLVQHTYRGKTGKGAWRTNAATGFPDLVLVRPPTLLFLELKAGHGTATAEQLMWLDALARVPGVVALVVTPSDGQLVHDLLTGPPVIACARQRREGDHR